MCARPKDRKFLFTELECRAAQRGVKVAVWQVQGSVVRREGGEPGLGHGGGWRSSARQACRAELRHGCLGKRRRGATERSGGSGAGLRRAALIGGLGGKVPEDLLDDAGLGDERDDAHGRPALQTDQGIDFIDAADELAWRRRMGAGRGPCRRRRRDSRETCTSGSVGGRGGQPPRPLSGGRE